MIISLTGFMGCGKSSVGRRLSELLCCPFVDLDAEIEKVAGCSVAEIFASCGETEFRRLEKETLKTVLETSATRQLYGIGIFPPPGRGRGPAIAGRGPMEYTALSPQHNEKLSPQMILALGGGAVMTPECEELVHGQTVCIYLRASVEELVGRLSGESSGRPLLSSGPKDTTDTPREDIPQEQQTKTSALRKRILELMSIRSETYERVSHHIIDTDGKSIDQVTREIIHL